MKNLDGLRGEVAGLGMNMKRPEGLAAGSGRV